MSAALELVCPAGTPASLRAAVDAGADVVYGGFRDQTNARNFPGLNFSREEMADGIAYAHARGCKVYLAINTFPRAGDPGPWRRAVDDAASLGADAVILADLGLLDYASERHPKLRRHLSVQAAAASAQAVRFYQEAFGIARVVLPRVLCLADIRTLIAETGIETEVFAFGGMCPMAEGRCSLSSYVTGRSPNRDGVCSPASHVRYEQRAGGLVARLGAFTVDLLEPGIAAGYPTLCKGCFVAAGVTGHLFEDPVSLSVDGMLEELRACGVAALKIEGRQRGRAYVAEVVRAWRRLLDSRTADEGASLRALAEGGRGTTGAYRRSWR